MISVSKKSASIKALEEAIEVQVRKGNDYQNPNSRVRQADYYPRGVYSILDIVNAKVLRMYSVLETMESGGKENFESVEDSAIDCINYCSFLVSWLRGGIDGQDPNRDIFNRNVARMAEAAYIASGEPGIINIDKTKFTGDVCSEIPLR